MELNLKDEPGEWRKSALLSLIGLGLIGSLLRWRHLLGNRGWLILLSILALIAIWAALQPRWFRGYYLFSMRAGFLTSRVLGAIILILFFVFILTPAGWMLRMIGKDLLQLRRPSNATTYW
ncbi:MAG: hypothetical protein ACREFR_18990, partial [Limisphaerales bacterium]